jgi:hypothetical protein
MKKLFRYKGKLYHQVGSHFNGGLEYLWLLPEGITQLNGNEEHLLEVEISNPNLVGLAGIEDRSEHGSQEGNKPSDSDESLGEREIDRDATEKFLEKSEKFRRILKQELDMTLDEVSAYLKENADRILDLPSDHRLSKDVLQCVYLYKRCRSEMTESVLRKAVSKLRRELEGE